MTHAEVVAIAHAHVGQRLRVTAPNGFQSVGVVGLWRNRSTGEDHPTLGGLLMGGEYAGATRVEVMGPNGRYGPTN